AAFIRRPMTWLRAIDRYRGTHSYSPNFGYDLCVERSTEQDRAELDLSCVEVLINGAEPVRRTTRDRFVSAFAASKFPPEAHCSGYGLAESSVLVSAGRNDREDPVVFLDAAALEQGQIVFRSGPDQGVREVLSDGIPGPGYDVRIVDPGTGAEAAPGTVGELWVRGPSVCPGYWRRDEETRAAFGGVLDGDDGGPYLRTGDLAFMHDGEIVICGRWKDLIVIRGRNLYPHDIELTAELAHESVRSGGSAAFAAEDAEGRETLVIVAEVDGELEQPDVVAAISGAVLQEFELHVMDVLLVAPRGIPKTSSGKKQRRATRALWRQARGVGVEAPASV
ncbi:MAG: hypothetical protein QOC66_1987, partial [Pseudonocardiales bacterium]|nr:hypothetical protein [Pseudonocardiales bacterium]